MYVFAGLGNPGARYAKNRHNIGYLVADEIARRHGFEGFRSRARLGADIAEGRIGDARVALMKPTTFMNESGRALGAVLRYYKIEPATLFVFYDELDLAPGKLRVRFGGGSAGHNGIKSLRAHIGPDYWRVRMGIGHPGDKDLVSDYVLSDFSKAESLWMDKLVDAAAEAAPLLLASEKNDFMTRVALLAPPPPRQQKENGEQPEDGI
ncbi:MAG: Peptidyl-tRNA hydrolase [Alphaproteobacteria bacterium MarineAlpha10_Bin2]|nr:MAG: Peptidyl-tRNA hydrolase [Alphaproteobacteria bacterium MarineAlpha10_Bin2]HIM45552.1 aminoacyl-tRNA hydrolase [Alphaproteobacteria bacterium]